MIKLWIFITLFTIVSVLSDDNSSSEEDDIKDSNFRGDQMKTAYIDKSFRSKNTFKCQLIKNALVTGENNANISPEDIDIIAAMGDALSTGIGLWGGTNVEFRGAAFTVGGDATIDGLVTFPNILHQFTEHIDGISHGMGTSDQLPINQFNVAVTGAETDHMETQADELIERVYHTYSLAQLEKKWILVFITIGTEEMCAKCDEPNIANLRKAIVKLKRAFPRVFVVVIGPVHVVKSSRLNYNLLKPRCKCLEPLTNKELRNIQKRWNEELLKLEAEFTKRNYTYFSLMALPHLTIESRNPEQLFIQGKPLLNRKGHTYAAKWLWNRLIAGPKYNASAVPLSEDSYYCPPIACPYFRTTQNLEDCQIMTLDEKDRIQKLTTTLTPLNLTYLDRRHQSIKEHVVLWVVGPVILSASAVFILGTFFYCHGMRATKGRFENVPGV